MLNVNVGGEKASKCRNHYVVLANYVRQLKFGPFNCKYVYNEVSIKRLNESSAPRMQESFTLDFVLPTGIDHFLAYKFHDLRINNKN